MEPGEVVNIECVDWTGGQIGNNDSADDIRDVDLTRVHYLSGPLHVASAEPGDVLVVEIVEIQPLPEQPWGFTGVFDKKNGGGFLDEHYPAAAKAIWDFEGMGRAQHRPLLADTMGRRICIVAPCAGRAVPRYDPSRAHVRGLDPVNITDLKTGDVLRRTSCSILGRQGRPS